MKQNRRRRRRRRRWPTKSAIIKRGFWLVLQPLTKNPRSEFQRVAISSRPPTEGVPRITQPNPNPHPNPSPNLNRWIPTHSSTAS
ncbi:hypothetical protein M5D96_011950 [Drosophila gunungcola]|uniref:Uncharacterized protein n=1 Tax=Drosophila gunungcola TaxID=103775 RepID=A0A9P9YE15_9MUSC|nr:hypothetical protein M5D96_011950 [Drosophila gunungcola]